MRKQSILHYYIVDKRTGNEVGYGYKAFKSKSHNDTRSKVSKIVKNYNKSRKYREMKVDYYTNPYYVGLKNRHFRK